MKKKSLFALVLLAALLFSCASPAPAIPSTPQPSETPAFTSTPIPTPTVTQTPPPAVTPTPSLEPRPAVRRVLIISIDGLRADALLRAEIPRISTLINGGASTFSAQTVFPSITLPAHASMLGGMCISKHGITWDDYQPAKGYLPGPTVFSVAHEAGLRTVMVVGKEKLVTIARPGTVDTFRFIYGDEGQIVRTALDEAAGGFGLLFVHLTYPDSFGHVDGWMSAKYLRSIGLDDGFVGVLLDGLQKLGILDDTLIILTADHGGHETFHGTARPEDMTIPWIVFGPGVEPSLSIQVPVSVTDTAATTVWALGLSLPAEWDGRPVVEAFGKTAEEAGVPSAKVDRCLP